MTSDRRELLRKSAVGAGALGVAWAAPRVEGLSLRPDYAAAQSGPACTTYAVTLNLQVEPNRTYYGGTGNLSHPNAGVIPLQASTRGFDGAVPATSKGFFYYGYPLGGPAVLGNCQGTIDALAPVGLAGTRASRQFGSLIYSLFSFQPLTLAGAPDALIVSGTLCCD